MDSFGYNIFILVNVWNWSCDFVFDTSIWNDQNSIKIR